MKSQIVNTENNNITAIYESPTIKTYTSSELLEMIGPVEAFSGNTNDIDDFMDPSGYYASEDEVT